MVVRVNNMKQIKTRWLSDKEYTACPTGQFKKEDIKNILKIFEESEATYCEIEYITVSFYDEKEETDEEYENRLKRETEAKELVEKVKFEEAKSIYNKLKDKFETH